MNTKKFDEVSRRSFLTSATLAGAAVWFAPRGLGAQEESPVTTIREAAATARITVQTLRKGITVLSGSGGNIAVLTGADGKLLVDAGITASRPRIVEALDGIGPEPVKHL